MDRLLLTKDSSLFKNVWWPWSLAISLGSYNLAASLNKGKVKEMRFKLFHPNFSSPGVREVGRMRTLQFFLLYFFSVYDMKYTRLYLKIILSRISYFYTYIY